MNVLPAHKYVHHMSVWCQQKSEEGFRFTELYLQVIVSHHMAVGN